MRTHIRTHTYAYAHTHTHTHLTFCCAQTFMSPSLYLLPTAILAFPPLASSLSFSNLFIAAAAAVTCNRALKAVR